MNEIRPADKITNPALFALARSKWPNLPVTSAMIHDIAKLTGEPLHVPASREAIAAGMAEIAKDRRASTARNDIAREYQRMGFDPATDYRNSTTKE